MPSSVVVFGGCGFIGSHVVEELIMRNITVKGADIISSFPCDVRLPGHISIYITGDIDFIYNFAGVADIATAISHPQETLESHILGTLNILEECRQQDIKRFVHASSVYVFSEYGSIYSVAKRASEDLIYEYHKLYGIPFTVLRYGSLYGPRAQPWNGVNRIVKQVMEGKVVFEGCPDEIREFIHVRDAARMSVDILHRSDCENKFLTLTGAEKLKWDDFIKMVFEIAGKEPQIKYKKMTRPHYKRTPYSFAPKLGEKMIPSQYTDLGQGIMEMIYEHTDADGG